MKPPPWSVREKTILRTHWGSESLTSIQKRLGTKGSSQKPLRSVDAIRRQALVLGLPSLRSKSLTLKDVSAVIGVTSVAMKRVLLWAGVPEFDPRYGLNNHRRTIDLEDALGAYDDWMHAETPEEAADRYMIGRETLRRILMAQNVQPYKVTGARKYYKFLPQEWDRILLDRNRIT